MKTIAIWNRYGELFRDGRCFETSEAPIGDGLLKPYRALRDRGRSHWSARVDTLDRLWAQATAGGIDGVVFFDYPTPQDVQALDALVAQGTPRYLVTWENELIVPENFDRSIHAKFTKVFTWHDGWRNSPTSPKRYVPIRVPQDFEGGKEVVETARLDRRVMDRTAHLVSAPRNFACMVASHKLTQRKPDGTWDRRELYSARIDTLQWFAVRAPKKLDLYGPGWEGVESWKGTIPPGGKRSVMSLYDFAFTYENATDLPGYITEKVFDAMMAGCVPIYWGAPNVRDYLPAKTFVDRTQFPDHEALFAYLSNVDEQWMEERRSAMASFLANEELIRPWTIDAFVDSIMKEIV